jgi:ribosomal protein S8
MHVTDPIADFLTRIRNAQMAGHRIVEIPASKLKKRMTEILYDQGYILKYTFDDTTLQTGHHQNCPEVRPRIKTTGNPRIGTCEQTRPAQVCRLRRYPPRHQRIGYDDRLYLQRGHDR